MNRVLSSFDIYVIVSELQELLGSYIDKIYQPTRDELLIRINTKKTNKKEIIYVKNGELFCTTQKKFTVPQKPSTFAMTCRKYLLNGKITAITQHEFDRIIKISINKKEGESFVFYIHPWEIDPKIPKMDSVGIFSRFRTYLNLHKTEDRFKRLLSDFHFSSISDCLL